MSTFSLRSALSSAIAEKNAQALEAFKLAKRLFKNNDESAGRYWLDEAKLLLRVSADLRKYIEENDPA